MQRRIYFSVFVPLAFFLTFVTQALAQSGEEPEEPTAEEASQQEEEEEPLERPSLGVGFIAREDVQLDGVLSEPAWAQAGASENLVVVEPVEGGEPAGETIIKVLGNPDELIIGVACHDPNPAGIVAFSKARDDELDNEDHITIVLDTFLDNRTGYVFAVNPNAARFDGLVISQGEDVNSDWDAVWEAKTSRDEEGWTAEIRIPIKSIGYRKGLANWGFNLERRVQRLQETSRWSGASQDYEVAQTSRAGLLTELPNFDFGLGLSIRPAITTGAVKESPDADREFTGDPSLDVTQRLGPNLLSSVTINTDFAETEVDARQTNLTRFEIEFPEKRTFFLEGSDIFQFGWGLDETLVPFYSRRIGLLFEEGEGGGDGLQIPIDVGGKVNGRVGNTNVGALVVRTRNVSGLDLGEATMGTVRIRQNILAESSVGMIATSGDQIGRSGSWLTGADFRYQTSEFRGEKNLIASFFGATTNREDFDERKNAYGFSVDYPNDLLDMSITSTRLDDGFDPSLGFVPRSGVHIWEGGVDYAPRPNWALVRQMFHEASFYLVNDLENQWESYHLGFVPVNWLLESGDSFEVGWSPEGDRPDEEFELFESEEKVVTVEAGSYTWNRYHVAGALADKRRVSGELRYEIGQYYGGDLDTIEGVLALNWPLISVELGAERNIGSMPEGDFTQNLYSGRFEVKVSADLNFSSFLQYDNESESLGTNTRMRWTFNPLGDLFVVYNHNLQRSLSDMMTRVWEYDSNELLVKLQYTWRN
ncbi:MAG TPA: DUF5916 domain-containing protein [Vicinamibacteria bacterium]|nr:DUF5916 domain-containing protein [Vicinamibacteria bacterium]